MRKKTGKKLESIVSWINECLHKNSIITPNDSIKDIDTSRLRQIDISVRLKDGPTEILEIVEVRDRGRPIDVTYIEQIHSKIRSVGAHAATIVSSTGFYQTAIIKAKALGIRTFNFQEALDYDWSGISKAKTIKFFKLNFENIKVTFIKEETNKIVNIHPNVINKFHEDKSIKFILDDNKDPSLSLIDFTNSVFKRYENKIFENLEPNKPPKYLRIINELNINPPSYFLGEDKKYHQIHRFLFEGNFWIEVNEMPFSVSKYVDPSTGEVIAELHKSSLELSGDKYGIEFLYEEPLKHKKEDTTFHIRLKKNE